MSENNMVYANTLVTSANGVINIGRHTSQIAFMNQSIDYADIKLNGNFTIRIGHGQVEAHFYNIIDGDYTTFQIMNANVDIAVYALG